MNTPCRHSHGQVAGVRPVFVSGVYRSNSTFLAAVIGCHEEYQATSSLVKFTRFCLGRFDPIDLPGNQERLVRETHARVSTRWDVRFDVDATLACARRDGGTYAALYNAIMAQILIDNGSPGVQWVEKVAMMWGAIPDFLSMFPNGKVLHVLRDPRSVAASYKRITNEPGVTYLDAAFNTVHAIQSLERCIAEFGGNRVMMVRSEDLLEAPEDWVRRICAFLEVPFSPRMMEPETHGHILGEEWRTNTSFCGILTGFHPPSSRWRDAMTRAETIFVEMVSQPYLAKYGYQADDHFPTRKDWNEIYGFLEDPFFRERFGRLLHTGEGSEGYRTNPFLTEMRIVFPERFEGSAHGND